MQDQNMEPKPNTFYQKGEKYIMEDVTSYSVAQIEKKNIISVGKWAVTSSSFEAWPSDSPACAQHTALCFSLIPSATHVRVLMNADGEGLAPKDALLKFKLVCV